LARASSTFIWFFPFRIVTIRTVVYWSH